MKTKREQIGDISDLRLVEEHSLNHISRNLLIEFQELLDNGHYFLVIPSTELNDFKNDTEFYKLYVPAVVINEMGDRNTFDVFGRDRKIREYDVNSVEAAIIGNEHAELTNDEIEEVYDRFAYE